MARMKGSKNKPKGIIDTVKETVVEAYREAKEEAINEVVSKWKAKPEMGDIKEPTPEVKPCSHCHHLGSHHYGSQHKWCNVQHCNCQALK